MKVCLYPIENNTNKYISNIKKTMEKKGYSFFSVNDIKKNRHLLKQIDVIHLNWYESVKGNSIFEILYKYIKKIVFLYICKFSKIKIIWTFHNKIPHETKYKKIAIYYQKFMIKISDKIIIHCKESIDILYNYNSKINFEKIEYIPHGNYINSYCEHKSLDEKETPRLSCLFIGSVSPYKNIEILIEAFKNFPDIELIIAGKPINENYGDKLKILSNGYDNIKLQLKFIPDTQISNIIQESHLLILPYNIESSLNSGTVILAFSHGKTVLCPNIGTLKDIDSNLYYGYDYISSDDHFNKLCEILTIVYNDFKKDKNILKNKGEEAFLLMKNEYNWELVGEKLDKIYTEKKEQ